MWQLWVCVGVLFLILEIFTPSMFFLNFSIAALLVAAMSCYIHSTTILVLIFCALSLLFIFTLRPMLIKLTSNSKKHQTGINSKYIGMKAKAIEAIDKDKGTISIYDERWQARNMEDFEIPVGSLVEIVSNDSLVMNVRKID